MSQFDTVIEIRKFLASAEPHECFTAKQIEVALGIPGLQVFSALAQMVGDKLVNLGEAPFGTVYSKASPFRYRLIVPVFAGTPEHIVETFDGHLICWCRREFHARLIADALNRS